MMFAFLALSQTVIAEDNPRAVIIFDASGSMWGQIDGKAKIEIAKDALKKVVQEWNPDVELGLTVYGHRKKGECNDIETVIPVGKINKKQVISTVMKIQPKGKTPISRSLKKVANEIKYTEEKATIILISDGKETCDPDPCGIAKALEKDGVDFVAHVIGFNVDKKTDAQLECIANATGGEYFSAKDASALNDAMKSIVAKVEQEPAKPKNNLEIIASEDKESKKLSVPVKISPVTEDENAEDNITKITTQKKKAVALFLAPGKYIAFTDYKGMKKETVFDVKEGEIKELQLILGNTGEVEMFPLESAGGKAIKSVSGTIHKIEDEDEVNGRFTIVKKKGTTFRLAEGKYIYRPRYENIEKEIHFEVKAGEKKRLEIIMGGTGKVEMFPVESSGGKAIKSLSGPMHKIENGNEVNGKFTTIKKKGTTLRLAEGKYVYRPKYENIEKEIHFEVKAGEKKRLEIIMGDTGEVELVAVEIVGWEAVKGAKGYRYKIEDGDKVQGKFISIKKKGTLQRLAEGEYIFEGKHKNIKKSFPFEVKAGEKLRLEMVFGGTEGAMK